jgi:acyl homoserine lactone synthase
MFNAHKFTENLFFKEQGYHVKLLTSPTEIRQAYRLRYEVFRNELGWIKENTARLDIDAYDNENTLLLGVIDSKSSLLTGLLRISLPKTTFMMEKEFDFLLSDYKIQKTPEVIEVSRVCTSPHLRQEHLHTHFGTFSLAMLLYKGLFHWSQKTGTHLMYMVIEKRLNRLLRISGFPTKTLNSPYLMPDGVQAVAVSIDWREFIQNNSRTRRKLMAWFNNGLQTPKDTQSVINWITGPLHPPLPLSSNPDRSPTDIPC